MSAQLPALQVVVPLLAAPLCLVLHRPFAAWLLTLVVSASSLLVSVALLGQILEQGVIDYTFGGWAAPFGIAYHIDFANAYVLLIVTAISTVVSIFAKRSVASEIETHSQGLFYTAWLLCLTGLLGITITGDAFNLFVFLEISSLSSYVLIAMGNDRKALTAAYQYLIMGTIGATFILIGIGLLYMLTGTLNMLDMAQRLVAVSDSRTARTGFAFLTVGLGLKIALFPLHLWLPNAYAYAPSAVSAFLAATATKVAVYVLLRFMFTVFGIDFALGAMPLSAGLVILGSVAVLSASTVAIFQHNLKRMLAYSSIAQIGYLVLGVSLATSAGLTATLLHLFNHALMKGALFLALGCIAWRLGSVRLGDLGGLGYRMPWTMGVFVIGGLSLIGLPLTAGFISKWYLVLAALERDWWPVVVVIIAGSLLAVIYVWRVIEAAYLGKTSEAVSGAEAPLSMLVPAWLLAIANLYFGINTELSAGIASQAAMVLFGGQP
ncbi:monovalent cation/H+ antiporter subunit D family protein [Gammaproteobacteria bacterium]|nr:monovalent cation/H+ antiporter subunit D family protein [Gammaproteobacteria bacterium]